MSKTQGPVKYTAGEWCLDPHSPGDVETPAGVQIAFGLAASQVGEVWHIKGPCPPDDEAAANARLIASSPDLLEAAREGLICAEADIEDRRQSNKEHGDDDASDPILAVLIARRDLIAAAIAKATG